MGWIVCGLQNCGLLLHDSLNLKIYATDDGRPIFEDRRLLLLEFPPICLVIGFVKALDVNLCSHRQHHSLAEDDSHRRGTVP